MKEVTFEFDTRKRLKCFPYDVRREVSHALYEAQKGGKHDKVKVLAGFEGAGVLEIRDRYDGCAYRVFYTTLIPSRICFLHVLKKKSNRGISTPKQEIDLVRKRLGPHAKNTTDEGTAQGVDPNHEKDQDCHND